MSEFSTQLKSQADIIRIIGEFVTLKRAGSDFVGLCPFHGEKSPSFHVHPDRQFYYCFGCHAHGDVFQFLMQMQKLSFPEAVAAVAERMGVPMPKREGDPVLDAERRDLLKVHAEAARYFQQQLHSPAGAAGRAYLSERQVATEAIERFQIGFAPENGRALTQFLRSRDLSPALALTAGLCQLRRDSAMRADEQGLDAGSASNASNASNASWDDLYDRFRGRVVFPIGDERGKVIAFGARALSTEGRPVPKYLNSPETPIYTKGRVLYNLDRARDSVRQLGYFILVEGYLDCLSVFMAGFTNVVASCGTALTSHQIGMVKRMAQNAVVNFDPDAAGSNAAERSIGLLLDDDFQIRIVSLTDGLDPDLFIRRNGAEAYGQALKTSRPFFDWLANRARQQFDLRRPEGKVAALNYLLPYLGRVDDELMRAELADRLAAQLDVESQMIRQQLRRAVRERRSQINLPSLPEEDLTLAEICVLRAWLEWDDQRPHLTALLREEELLHGLPSQPLFQALCAQVGDGPCDVAALAAQLEPADRHLMARLVLQQRDPLEEKAVVDAVEGLRDRRLEEKRKELPKLIQAATAAGDRERLQELLRLRLEWDRQHQQRRQQFEIR